MRVLRRLRLRGLAVGLVIGLAVGGTVAYAAIPDSTTGQIAACYPTSGPNKGKLSVIDASAGQSCAAGEAALSWQQRPFCDDWPHPGVDYSMPGSTPGNGCNFTGLGFPSGDVTNGNFTDANLTGARMELIVTGADFTGANLTNAEVPADFTSAQLRSASAVVGINLFNEDIEGWDLSGLDMSGADLSNSRATGANFTNANVSRALFRETILTGANFTGADLRGANFSAAILTHAKFTNANLGGVQWHNVTCPDGTNSSKHASTCAGHLTR